MVEAIKYKKDYCVDFVHSYYDTIDEIYIPSIKIAFNYSHDANGSTTFNVFACERSGNYTIGKPIPKFSLAIVEDCNAAVKNIEDGKIYGNTDPGGWLKRMEKYWVDYKPDVETPFEKISIDETVVDKLKKIVDMNKVKDEVMIELDSYLPHPSKDNNKMTMYSIDDPEFANVKKYLVDKYGELC